MVLRVLTAAGRRAELLPWKAFESSAAFLLFIRTNITTSRFAVKKEGIAGSGMAEGSSAVLVQPVVPLGSWTKCRDPYLICACRPPLQINRRVWGGRPHVRGPLCAKAYHTGRGAGLLRSPYFCLLRHRLLELQFGENSFIFIWVLSLT